MTLRVYNTLGREVQDFHPLEEGLVRMYNCGPTVYNRPHIGNLRAFVVADVLRRYLGWKGWRVRQVMNLTDVDDKTIKGAREAGESLRAFTGRWARHFFEDLEALGCEKAEHYPRATEHIPEMIALVQRLFERGVAYERAGSVWFRVSAFRDYGKLSQADLAALEAGARVDPSETGKEEPFDFALWKGWTADDGEVVWDSPWGRGRPGWHLECSAMSMRYLGETFDIHTGGQDLIFPHHENEVGQSEAATGMPFVRYWLHNGFLLVGGQKMSKSLGNVYNLDDVGQRGFRGAELRFFYLSTHYRAPFDFTWKSLESTKGGLDRLNELRGRLERTDPSRDDPSRDRKGTRPPTCGLSQVGSTPGGRAIGRADPEIVALSARVLADFESAMDDDLNTPAAMGAVFGWVREVNRRALSAADAAKVGATLDRLDQVLGVLGGVEEKRLTSEEELLVQQRERARQERDWAAADRLRKELAARGITVTDTPQGQRAQKK